MFWRLALSTSMCGTVKWEILPKSCKGIPGSRLCCPEGLLSAIQDGDNMSLPVRVSLGVGINEVAVRYDLSVSDFSTVLMEI